MVVYDTNYNSFTNYGDDFLLFLGNDHGERGQRNIFYTQLNSTTLFTFTAAAEYIHVYNLDPASLSFQTVEPINHIMFGDSPCLASSNTLSDIAQLYITGGYTNSSTFYEIYPFFWIFDLIEYSWTRGNDMNFARYSHGCIVADDMLWVMGTVPQIETINITDIGNAKWAVCNNLSVEGNLTAFGVVSTHDIDPIWCRMFGVNGTFCNDHSIYIIGGWVVDYDSGHNSDTVYIIDTKWGNMTYNTLPFGVSALPTIRLGGTIYGFGGWNATSKWRDGHSLDISMRHDLLSGLHFHSMTSVILLFPHVFTIDTNKCSATGYQEILTGMRNIVTLCTFN